MHEAHFSHSDLLYLGLMTSTYLPFTTPDYDTFTRAV